MPLFKNMSILPFDNINTQMTALFMFKYPIIFNGYFSMAILNWTKKFILVTQDHPQKFTNPIYAP